MKVNYIGNYETEIENTKVRTDRKGEINDSFSIKS